MRCAPLESGASDGAVFHVKRRAAASFKPSQPRGTPYKNDSTTSAAGADDCARELGRSMDMDEVVLAAGRQGPFPDRAARPSAARQWHRPATASRSSLK